MMVLRIAPALQYLHMLCLNNDAYCIRHLDLQRAQPHNSMYDGSIISQVSVVC
jgi:hypothetical protein